MNASDACPQPARSFRSMSNDDAALNDAVDKIFAHWPLLAWMALCDAELQERFAHLLEIEWM